MEMKIRTSITVFGWPKKLVGSLRTACVTMILPLLVLLTLPAVVQAGYTVITNADNTLTITGYSGSGGALTIPSTLYSLPVTGIGEDAFYENTSLTSVTIPSTVTSIGGGPFDDCIFLTEIAVDPSNPAYISVGGILFNKSQTTLIQYPPHKSGASYTVPNSVITIGDDAFADSDYLTSVTIGTNVSSIGGGAFFFMGLTTITIPSSVTNIGDYAFEDDALLTNGIYFEGNAPTCGTFTFETHSGGKTIAYYLCGTSGWDNIFGEFYRIPAVQLCSALLTVSTNGIGALSPNYNGASLQVGNSYSIIATAGTGFLFTNWTGGTNLPLMVLTDSPTVEFVMEPHLMLRANFLDTKQPTITITNLALGHWVSNAEFCVTGTAMDNVQVSNVWCQLNNGAWEMAVGTINWAYCVTLTPATNLVRAYAVDASGNVSPTNSVSLVYVVSAPLQVQRTGLGSLSPNYSNAVLGVGQSYSMTATPGTGFAFTNWTGGTDLPLTVLTNGRTVQFIMVSNLTLQANFVDVQKPTNNITAPAQNQRWSSVAFTIKGTATDNVGVSNVFYALNGSLWAAAATTNNWTNWSAEATLTPGTNFIQAYALDTSGNVSLIHTSSVIYIVSNQLMLAISPPNGGTVSGVTNGQWLDINLAYTATAKSNGTAGFLFENWTQTTNGTDWATSTVPLLHFTMQTNLTLRANFTDVQKPKISITSPNPNQRWSNAVFAVKGTANDNVQVSNVWYQLNNGGWEMAIGTTNWTNYATLTPGTNLVRAYAVDTSGNKSTTNSVSFVYVVSAPLHVQMTGRGTLSPNYSSAWLAINYTYSMTATPAQGFAFYYWSGGVPMSDNRTLTFTMSSNLTIIANFKDVTKPVTTITFPTANENRSNSVITVTGKASDNVGVAEVWVQINNGGWTAADSANGFTNWSAANLPVLFGTNIVQACAVDAAGNVSPTNEVKFIGVLTPTSLAGYAATVKRSGGKPNIVVTWGESTWAQTGMASDTNVNDYCAGTYTYITNGPNTAILTNVDIGMMSALGTTNVTVVNVTFTSATSGNYVWSSENDSGSGTMAFSRVSNLVPETLAGKTIQIYQGSTLISTIILGTDGTFTSTNKNGSHYGTYALTQFSPTVAILQSYFNDPHDAGGEQCLELTFTSATAGQVIGSYYDNPTYGNNPADIGVGTFEIK